MRLVILGLGYTAARFADAARAAGAVVTAVRSRPGPDTLTLDDPALPAAIGAATHILSSVPPDRDGHDPVLAMHGARLAGCDARWVGYLSSTGVYGDARGAWVDEASDVNGRRSGRNAADLAWGALHPQVRVFRLPGIYGPGRSALDRLRHGPVARIELPGHVFSRIHVDDIVGAVMASTVRGPAGIYNLADDEPAAGEAVTAHAARLLGMEPAPLQSLGEAELSPMGRAFYGECRRVANGKMKRALGHQLRYPDYRTGLAACLQEMVS
ncbi:SDR family NAD(P)-dependent oxidoreductase [Sandarakinorhabdus sp.]|uniref:SDR family NAD(P)-dependent oxidoreductase n=1 Tax=Sandarakinorhabdus sp. TaxID=1916663 RepID=UPI00286E1DD3|nr:SDR family NAD(P)-dependent oxidoreductase [Sandarakinorhabdus sp.]